MRGDDKKFIIDGSVIKRPSILKEIFKEIGSVVAICYSYFLNVFTYFSTVLLNLFTSRQIMFVDLSLHNRLLGRCSLLIKV